MQTKAEISSRVIQLESEVAKLKEDLNALNESHEFVHQLSLELKLGQATGEMWSQRYRDRSLREPAVIETEMKFWSKSLGEMRIIMSKSQ
jgi:hypothetical protein